MTTTLEPSLVADLAATVSGSVLGPQDAGYDAARACTTASSTEGRS